MYVRFEVVRWGEAGAGRKLKLKLPKVCRRPLDETGCWNTVDAGAAGGD